jgi:hypothetical protein
MIHDETFFYTLEDKETQPIILIKIAKMLNDQVIISTHHRGWWSSGNECSPK